MPALLMRLCSPHLCLPAPAVCLPLSTAYRQLMHARQNKFKVPPHPAAVANSAEARSASQQDQGVAPTTRPQIIIITGPTAVGKTKLGLELAKRIGGEIISADSVQVYRGLDVGSDKLPLDQREGIPHHLIDIMDPSEEFSAGDFHKLGRQAAEDIISRGKIPIVAGGTGFYLRWFTYGKPSTPASSPETAAKALELVGEAWKQAAAQVSAAQQEHLQQQQQQREQGQPNPQAVDSGLQAQQPPQLQTNCQAAGGPSSDNPAASSSGPVTDLQEQQVVHDAQPMGSLRQQQQYATSTIHTGSQHQQATASEHQVAAKLPAVSAEARAAALQLPEEQRWDVAIDIVRDLGDPETAVRIRAEKNNWYRLQRVLQILLQNGGRPLSQLDIDTTKELDYDFRCFFLHRPRLELFERIIYRVEEMVAGGLLSEALMLLDHGMQPNSNIATRAIGYRQALEFMQAAIDKGSASKEDLQQMIFDIATASRNLVKNQTTWFRDDGMFRWLDVSGRSTEEVLQEVLEELQKPQHEGGCGDSGRFDKQTLAALKRYVPSLKLYNDPDRVVAVLDWVAAAAAARQSAVNGDARQQEAAGTVPASGITVLSS